MTEHPNYCHCQEVDFGSYESCVTVVLPWAGAKVRGIDACIVPEVAGLWRRGIQTIESCCGHNQLRGYVFVEDKDIEAMIALGYEQDPRCEHPNAFLSKTLPSVDLPNQDWRKISERSAAAEIGKTGGGE